MDILELIFQAGIVGCGGAGFPTHIKLNAKVNNFIINGVECEPLLRTDRYLMIHKADELVQATEMVAKKLNAKDIYIALKENYHEEIESIQAAIKKFKSKIRIYKMENYYPAGDEQMVVCDVLGKTIPPGGIPLDVSAVVSNVETMIGVYNASKGINFTHKYLTINGAVKKPVIAYVPIGTSFGDCLKLAGGSTLDRYKIIDGGPLMGDVLDFDSYKNQRVTKIASGILAIPEESYLSTRSDISLSHMLNRAKSSCIQCTYCTQMCPRHLIGHPLEPHRIMRKVAYSNSLSEILDDHITKQALTCCECGICELFACPMQIQPLRVNQLLKEEYAKHNIRYTKEEKPYNEREEHEYRKIPSQRMAAKVDVIDYYDNDVTTLVKYEPKKVSISLKQHIGSPAKSVVAIGEQVKCGQIIGVCKKDELGSNIHASIDGKVIEVGEEIVIEKQ
ncbi:MAG TPA: 4Fe-4S dicluster domain-containing protein [Oscillospiraceae bacterium]|nr:4Fe-4S dicluster domain-containing protein [Oscillospiraceae bacterium]